MARACASMAARWSRSTVSAAAAHTAAASASATSALRRAGQQLRRVARDEAGVERGVREGRVPGDGAEQAEIGRTPTTSYSASAAARRRTAAARSSPQTISLAIIGS